MPAFEMHITARWGDMDFNAHMANTAYLDAAADARIEYFRRCGFAPEAFAQHGFGPVVRRDEIDYRREVRLGERVRVALMLAGLNGDASRFAVRNTFHREDGELAATITSFGGWLDLRKRALIVPPQEIADALGALPRTEDFATLAPLRS